jgi:hypothetical protein
MSLQHQNRDHTFPFSAPTGTTQTHVAAVQHQGEGSSWFSPVLGPRHLWKRSSVVACDWISSTLGRHQTKSTLRRSASWGGESSLQWERGCREGRGVTTPGDQSWRRQWPDLGEHLGDCVRWGTRFASLQDEEWVDCFLYCYINTGPTCHIS